jgi:hypothetical protein
LEKWEEGKRRNHRLRLVVLWCLVACSMLFLTVSGDFLAKFGNTASAFDSAPAAAWIVEAKADSAVSSLQLGSSAKSVSFDFFVQNYSGSAVCEVAAEYQITVDLPEEIYQAAETETGTEAEQTTEINDLTGLAVTLTADGTDYPGTLGADHRYTFDHTFSFPAGEKTSQKFTLTIDRGEAVIAQAVSVKDIKVRVKSRQVGIE